MVERVRDAVGAHPEIVPLTLTHRHRSPSLLRWSETVPEHPRRGGDLTAAGESIALRAVLGYVIGAVQLEHLGPLSGTGTAAMSQLPVADFHISPIPPAQHVPSDPTRSSAAGSPSCCAGWPTRQPDDPEGLRVSED